MNEELGKNLNKSRKSLGWLRAWLVLFGATFVIVFAISWAFDHTGGWSDRFGFGCFSCIVGGVVATVFIGLWAIKRWIFCWKNFGRFLFVCACLVTFIALLYAEEDWRTKINLDKYEQQWTGKGEKFNYKDVIPPTVPDDQNFAMAPIWVESIKAVMRPENSVKWFGSYAEDGRTNFVNRLDMPLTLDNENGPAIGYWPKATMTNLKPWQDYYRNLEAKTNSFPIPSQSQTPAQDVLYALGKYDPAIDELRAASQLPAARFPVDYSEQPPAEILLPHLAMLKRCSQVLQLRALAELQNGESEKALQDINLAFRLTDTIRREPFLISQLIRIAMLQITLQPIYEGLAERQWSDTQLAQIDQGLAKLDFLADYESAIRGERALETANTEYLRRTRDFRLLDYSENGSHQDPVSRLAFHLPPDAFFYQNELSMLQIDQEDGLPMVDVEDRTVSPHIVQQLNTDESKTLKHSSYGNVLARLIMPNLRSAVQKHAYAQESVDLARVAIALERYRLAFGVYPGSLDVLSPHLIDTVPNDVIGGQPLHYKHTGDGRFILYSVGWNGRDDGGTVVVGKGSSGTVNTDEGDWVWRYPAAD